MRLPTPIVVASRCLGFDNCRYDGEIVRNDVVARIAGHVRILPVCPEIEIGLGVPRAPIRIVRAGKADTLIQPETGRDLTADMDAFSKRFFEWVGEKGVDGFIMKAHSPSCGIDDVRIFTAADSDESSETADGLFARAARKHFPDAVVEDELTLQDVVTRHLFVSALYENAAKRLGRKLPRDWQVPPDLG